MRHHIVALTITIALGGPAFALAAASTQATRDLRAAIAANDASAVARALSAGADPNVPDEYALTPLVRAVITGNDAIVLDLLRRGADPDPRNVARSPLEVAFESVWNRRVVCNVQMVKLLLAHGANPNRPFPGGDGELPLQSALELGDVSCVNVLLDSGADATARSPRGKSLLEAAIQGASATGEFDLIDRALALGADVNGPPGRRGGPLIEATARHNIAAVQLLLKRGANPCLAEPNKPSAWDFARGLGYKDASDLIAPYRCGGESTPISAAAPR